jgi:hypothetical protein
MNHRPRSNQFSILQILIAITICAAILGVIMATRQSQIYAGFALTWIAASLVLTGIVYGRGSARAFFIGAAVPVVGNLWSFATDSRFIGPMALSMLLLALVGGLASAALAWWLVPSSDDASRP